MKLNFVTLDVFTSTKFAGNQVAVVSIPHELVHSISYEQKLKIAQEFKLAETVFILEPSEQDAVDIPVNIYLPSTEIPFAGHPTIGTGAYLLQYQKRDIKAIVPKVGRVQLTLNGETGAVSAAIPQEVYLDTHTVPCQLRLPGPARCPLFSIVKGMTFTLVALPDLDALAAATRSFTDPTEFDEGWDNGFRGTKYYVEQGSDDKGRRLLRTRMHGAANDAVEDAATGSASCALACFLTLQISAEGGAGPFAYHIVQGVEMGRPSDIFVTVQRTPDGKAIETVILEGTAIKVMEGSIDLD